MKGPFVNGGCHIPYTTSSCSLVFFLVAACDQKKLGWYTVPSTCSSHSFDTSFREHPFCPEIPSGCCM